MPARCYAIERFLPQAARTTQWNGNPALRDCAPLAPLVGQNDDRQTPLVVMIQSLFQIELLLYFDKGMSSFFPSRGFRSSRGRYVCNKIKS